MTARLIVRRVRRLNSAAAPGAAQGELFTAYRFHGCFTDSPMSILQAESQHRGPAASGPPTRDDRTTHVLERLSTLAGLIS